MNMHTDPRFATMGRRVVDEATDQGLRAYMLKVYNYMTAAMALTGLVAFIVGTTPQLLSVFYSMTPQGYLKPNILGWIVTFAPLGFVFFLGARLHSMRVQAAQTTFWLFAGVMGLSLSYIFVTYTGVSVARVFFITAAAFAGLSLYGYTTKRNLSAMGSFLMMGLIGGLIAMVVNFFLASSVLHMAISALFLLVFAGLTAYDTQKIKSMYYHVSGDQAVAEKTAIMGALSLYLDFINMFLIMLQFFGNRE